MKKLFVLTIFIGILFGCKDENIKWAYVSEMKLDSIAPVGIVFLSDTIVVSDGDHNRLIYMSKKGDFIKQVKGFNRPMHIAESKGEILVPNYITNKLQKIKGGKISDLKIPFELDAPAGVFIQKNELAVVDFYHHRVWFYNGDSWISIGEKGKEFGEFYYPTDVHLEKDKIFVADAYNHRIQVFNKQGEFLEVIGEHENMNVASGIHVHQNQIFVTDFEQNRVLVFSLKGVKKQILSEGFEGPIDLNIMDNKLYVINYKGKSITVYKQ